MPYKSPSKKSLGSKLLFTTLLLILTVQEQPSFSRGGTQESDTLLERIPAEEAARLALLDTLYYRTEDWMRLFEKKISQTQSVPQNLQTEMELMKHHFYLAALNVELSHNLGFTRKYKIDEIEDNCLAHIRLAKKIANAILLKENLPTQEAAQAYLYLGAAEGYLGILEFGAGNFIQALINGFQADNHLEKGLVLAPERNDAYLGLGVYRYSNSRMGGIGNFLMQGGDDLRQIGISFIERAVRKGEITTPLAIKTLAWFYISEQINPDNANLPQGHHLSAAFSRTRVWELIQELETRYFKNPPTKDFIGNKEMAMLKGLQNVLDGKYEKARDQFKTILKIIEYLRTNKGYKINPQQDRSIRAGLEFCEAMLLGSRVPSQPRLKNSDCQKVNQQIEYLENGGTVLEYDLKKIREEMQNLFHDRLVDLRKAKC